jgi:ectoine hydroxylase-related dioxygenase (phytanoyl-CoA dioxygenase family)
VTGTVNGSADAIRRDYARTGFVVFRNVLDPGLIADTSRHVDWLLDRHPDLRADELGHELARDDPFWYRLVSDPRLVDIAEIFIGSDVALFASHYICKEPRIGRAVPWHQDGGYWPLEPMEVVSLWLAVTESTRANGCLKLVPGSHTTRLMEMVPTNRDEVLPLEVPVAVDEREAVALELAPGDVSVHHPNIVHGSDANTSTSWRRGLTIRYIPTTTRILDAGMSAAFLLRGDAVPGVNEYLSVPPYDPERHMAFEN